MTQITHDVARNTAGAATHQQDAERQGRVKMPNRTFDVGIAEGHAVTFSGGMAKDGLIPFCNIYSSFAQRAYDNIIHDMALLNLPVVPSAVLPTWQASMAWCQ